MFLKKLAKWSYLTFQDLQGHTSFNANLIMLAFIQNFDEIRIDLR